MTEEEQTPKGKGYYLTEDIIRELNLMLNDLEVLIPKKELLKCCKGKWYSEKQHKEALQEQARQIRKWLKDRNVCCGAHSSFYDEYDEQWVKKNEMSNM